MNVDEDSSTKEKVATSTTETSTSSSTNDSTINEDKIMNETTTDAPTAPKSSTSSIPSTDALEESSSVVDNSNTSNNGSNYRPTTQTLDYSNRKVVVYNVDKFINSTKLSKLVDEWTTNLPIVKVEKAKKPPKDNFVTLTFEEEHMVEPFIEHFIQNNFSNKSGKRLFAKSVKPKFSRENGEGNDDDDEQRNRRNNRNNKKNKKRSRHGEEENEEGGDNDDAKSKRTKLVSSKPKTLDEIRDAVTPLWNMSYDKQLDQKKFTMIKKCAVKIIKEMKSNFRNRDKEVKRNPKHMKPMRPYDWIDRKSPIMVQDCIPSPTIHEYRNKVEFTFGYRSDETNVVLEKGGSNTEEADEQHKKESMTTVAAATTATAKTMETEAETKTEKEEGALGSSLPTTTTTVTGDAAVAASDTSTTATANNNHASDDNGDEKDNTTTTTTKKVPCVGFCASGWNGDISLPHGCQNIPLEACGIADLFNKYLSTSKLPVYDVIAHKGIWRQVTIRLSRRTNQCMLIVQHASPTSCGAGNGTTTNDDEDYSSIFEEESKQLIELLTKDIIPISSVTTTDETKNTSSIGKSSGPRFDMKITSIYFQLYDGLSKPDSSHPVQHMYGLKQMEEHLGKCTFDISPGAFFQVNTQGAEVLYGLVVDELRTIQQKNNKEDESTQDDNNRNKTKQSKTLLLDVCCGTGTIGITCLKEGVVDDVIGVDISPPAIDDAIRNAKRNISSSDKATKFIASRAETVLGNELQSVVKQQQYSNIVAVVDPAREGLHSDVIRSLRSCNLIQHLIYVSCNPDGTLVRDAAMLCGYMTKKYTGYPFKIIKAQPVDMFPLTNHCEMIMTFERMSSEEYNKCFME